MFEGNEKGFWKKITDLDDPIKVECMYNEYVEKKKQIVFEKNQKRDKKKKNKDKTVFPNSHNLRDFSKLEDESFGKRNFVLICSGSFNPFHFGHLQIMDSAKQYVENEYDKKGNCKVIGGFFIPTSNSGLIKKVMIN